MSGQGKRPVARSNQRGMVLIMLVVMILLVVMVYQSRRLTLKNAALADQISQLSELIVEEEGRSEQIEDFRAYTRSDEYVEKTAREKFGFVYPDEVIFRSAGSCRTGDRGEIALRNVVLQSCLFFIAYCL